MKNIHSMARILFGLVFVVFGVTHFMIASDLALGAPQWIPEILRLVGVYLMAATFLFGGLMIVANKKVGIGAFGIGVWLIFLTLTVNGPALAGGNQGAMVQILKDLGLLSMALMLFSKDCEEFMAMGMKKGDSGESM